MSAATQMAGQTKIFGVRVGVDPKILVGGFFVLAAILFWYNLHGSEDERGTVARPAVAPTAPAGTAKRAALRRSSNRQNERGELRLKPVDPSRGDIDPTLKLGLLERLQGVKLAPGSRNLFEAGATAVAANLPPLPKAARMVPGPLPATQYPTTVTTLALALNIPFKYYGFVKPGSKGDSDRGFFMEGDNILVATEGDVLEQRFLIVTLTPTKARVEDIQVKQGQDLPVTPEAVAQ
jgi:hypothetical protein